MTRSMQKNSFIDLENLVKKMLDSQNVEVLMNGDYKIERRNCVVWRKSVQSHATKPWKYCKHPWLKMDFKTRINYQTHAWILYIRHFMPRIIVWIFIASHITEPTIKDVKNINNDIELCRRKSNRDLNSVPLDIGPLVMVIFVYAEF